MYFISECNVNHIKISGDNSGFDNCNGRLAIYHYDGEN